MATATIELEFAFTDESTEKISAGPFSPSAAAITGLKANIAMFKQSAMATAMQYIVNSNGATLDSDVIISAATIITQETTNYDLSATVRNGAALGSAYNSQMGNVSISGGGENNG